LGKNAGVESRQELDRGLVQPVVDFADGDRQPFSVANNKDDRVLVLHSKDFEGSYDSGSENGAVPIVVKLPADTRSTVKYERFELGVREGGELVRELGRVQVRAADAAGAGADQDLAFGQNRVGDGVDNQIALAEYRGTHGIFSLDWTAA
jgi:hypothetical protein